MIFKYQKFRNIYRFANKKPAQFHRSPKRLSKSISPRCSTKTTTMRAQPRCSQANIPPPSKRVFITLSDHVMQLRDRMLKCGKMESNENFIFSQPNVPRFCHRTKRWLRFNRTQPSCFAFINHDALITPFARLVGWMKVFRRGKLGSHS